MTLYGQSNNQPAFLIFWVSGGLWSAKFCRYLLSLSAVYQVAFEAVDTG